MCGKLGRARSIITVPDRKFWCKGKEEQGGFKRPICCWDIPTSKMTRFCHLHLTDIFILACSKETIKPTELKYSLKESLFYVEWDSSLIKLVQACSQKLWWSVFWWHAKAHEIDVSAMVIDCQKWPHNYIRVNATDF